MSGVIFFRQCFSTVLTDDVIALVRHNGNGFFYMIASHLNSFFPAVFSVDILIYCHAQFRHLASRKLI